MGHETGLSPEERLSKAAKDLEYILAEWNTRPDNKPYKYANYEEWAGDRPTPSNEAEALVLEVSELAFEAAREREE